MSGKENSSGPEKKLTARRDPALLTLASLIGSGIIFSMLYALNAKSIGEWLSQLAVAALMSGAATMVGGLLGFLFGIPRTSQGDEGAIGGSNGDTSLNRRVAYRANTSLEQISDWLTKILVGVGLTQIASLRSQFLVLSQRLGNAFGGRPIDEAFVTALMSMLVVAGFLFGFLWTRIYLQGAFRAADFDALLGEVRDEMGRQADVDAKAMNLAYQQLSTAPGQAAVAEEQLATALSNASSNAQLFVFERAHENRSKNWQEKSSKPAMERSIPIFRALIKSAVDSPVAHRYYGQLGFALKDQSSPDWKGALEALSTAIRLRGPVEDFGYSYYELNRAICRVMLDGSFLQSKPSDPAARAAIAADLSIAWQSGVEDIIRQDEALMRWMALNEITEASLKKP